MTEGAPGTLKVWVIVNEHGLSLVDVDTRRIMAFDDEYHAVVAARNEVSPVAGANWRATMILYGTLDTRGRNGPNVSARRLCVAMLAKKP